MSKTKKTTTSPEEPATIEDTSVNVTETAGRSGQRNKVSPKPAAIEILPEDGAAAPAAAEAETQPPVVMPEPNGRTALSSRSTVPRWTTLKT